LNADVQCLNECQSFYGRDRWLAGHRNGATGLANPNTQDIRSKLLFNGCGRDMALTNGTDYIDGVSYIDTQLRTQPNAMTNDVRYYIYVVPI
jgi:hypothetical protein